MREPGTGFSYGVSTLVVGRLIEVASGLPLEEAMERLLLAPLGMVDTAFFCRDAAQASRLARLYEVAPGAAATPASAPGVGTGGAEGGGGSGRREEAPPAFREVEGPRRIFSYDRATGRGPNADGGLFSTVPDLARFARFLSSDGLGVCSAETLRLALSDQLAAAGLPPLPQTFLGFSSGFGLCTYTYERDGLRLCGWSGLAGTHLCVEPASGRRLLLMTQCLPFSWRWQERIVRDWPRPPSAMEGV